MTPEEIRERRKASEILGIHENLKQRFRKIQGAHIDYLGRKLGPTSIDRIPEIDPETLEAFDTKYRAETEPQIYQRLEALKTELGPDWNDFKKLIWAKANLAWAKEASRYPLDDICHPTP